MRSSFLQNTVLVFGSLFVGIALTAWADKLAPSMMLVALIAVIPTFVIIRQPFLGLVALVSCVQTDAIANLVFEGFSSFGVKILVLLTLAGLVFVPANRSRAKKQDTGTIAETMLVLLVLVLLISAVLAHDLGLALDTFRRFAGVVILCFLVIALSDTTRRLEILLLAIMATTLISSLIVIYDWSFSDNLVGTKGAIEGSAQESGNRSRGSYGGAAPMAATMILCGTTLAAVFCARTPRWRRFTAATLMVGSLGIFLNATRSASLTYLIMAVWLVLKFRRHRMFPVVVLAILLAAVIFLALIPAEHWERMSALMDPDKDITIYRRLSYHIIGFDLVSQFPVFGAGFGNFPLFFDDLDYRWLTGRVPDEDGFKQLHNQYLQVAAESGIVALAAYIALLASCFMGLGRVCRRAASPAVGLLAEAVQFSFASLLIQIAFLSNKLNKYLWIYIGLAIALHYVNKAEARRLAAAGIDEPAVLGPRSASG